MKKYLVLLLVLFIVPLFADAAEQVTAGTIIDQINAGKAVSYEGAIITGDLEFISLKDRTQKKSGLLSKTFTYHVRVPVTFKNCTFQGDVLAYQHIEDEKETHNASFYEKVTFEGCKFKQKSAFKYSKFHKWAGFSGNIYEDEALFKYAKFSEKVNFSISEFKDHANFKYAEFPEDADFSKAKFSGDANFKYTKFKGNVNFEKAYIDGEANFKYTKFPRGVNFKDVVFVEEVNFKYTKFSKPVDFKGTSFKGGMNDKYAKVEGKPLKDYLY